MVARSLELLTRRRTWIPILAMALCAPALFGGVELDDLFHQQLALGGGDLLGSAFTFVGERGRAQHVAMVDLPWWSERGLRLDLFRPLAGLTHWIDWTLWPSAPWAMHLHSVLWYGGLVALVGAVHRTRDEHATRATLATLVFAVSQAHGMNVGWLAARNSLIGAALGVAALLAHRAWRAHGGAWRAPMGPLLFALALLANQGAVAFFTYLVAFAVVLDRGPRRALALLPYVAVVMAWRAWSALEGYGAAHGGMYVEPTSAPLEYVARALVHGVLLLAARSGIAVVDGLGGLPGAYAIALVFAAPFVALLAWLVSLRAREDALVRAWALGTLGTMVTAGALVPTDRNLLVVGVGACFLLADLILHGLGSARSKSARAGAIALLILHVPLSALLLPLRVASSRWVHSMIAPIEPALPSDERVTERSIVMTSAPSDLAMLYPRVMRELRGAHAPARIQYLYAGPGTLTLERRAHDVIVLRSSVPWLAAPLDRLYRRDVGFEVGERTPGDCFDAVVEELEGTLPRAVRFELHGRGEGCEPVFMSWQGDRPRLLELPAPGTTLTLPPAILPAPSSPATATDRAAPSRSD